MKRPRIGTLGGAALLSTLLPFIGAQAGFVASPMELHYEVAAGTEGALTLNISNKADDPLTVRMYLVDSRFGRDGAEENLDPGTLDRSCADWVRLEENVLDFGPREVRRVRVSLAAPPAARGSYWTKLFLEEISSPQVTTTVHGDRTYNIFMKQRLGVRIFQDVPGTGAPDVSIASMEIRESEDERHSAVLVDVVNTGNTILRCTGELELRDATGAVAEKIPMGSLGRFVVFPDGERTIAARPRPDLPPGTYTALALIDFGGDHLVAGDVLLEVPAPAVARGDERTGGS
jgi:hypothetical protein